MAAGAGVISASGFTSGCHTGSERGAPANPPPAQGRGVGFVLSHEQFHTDQLVSQAQAAEKAGFQYVWASDHLQPWQDNEGHSIFPG